MFYRKFNKKENSIQKSHFKGNEDIGNKVKIKGFNNKFAIKKSIYVYNIEEDISFNFKKGDLIYTNLSLEMRGQTTSLKQNLLISILVDDDFIKNDTGIVYFILNEHQVNSFLEKSRENNLDDKDLRWFEGLYSNIISIDLDTFKLVDECNIDYEMFYNRVSKVVDKDNGFSSRV